MKLILGDSLQKLADLPTATVDAVVTDPPYGLAFMGKRWDYDVPSVELWREVLRVLKPGGHLLSFGGTRTYHRMVCAIEDAGFEIRDQVQWIYGSGFPKSLDVSKAIDKAAGAEREVIGEKVRADGKVAGLIKPMNGGAFSDNKEALGKVVMETAPATDDAKRWQGWGTALKPANEPIVLARKPLEKGFTVAQNVLKYGTGALNVDASRIELQNGETTHGSGKSQSSNPATAFGDMGEKRVGVPNIKSTQGRWPANLLMDEHAAALLDEQSGESSARGGKPKEKSDKPGQIAFSAVGGDKVVRNDSGGASRFFYVAKASKRERNAGLEGMPLQQRNITQGHGRGAINTSKGDGTGIRENKPCANVHPTVKPVKLMEYLVRMITPPGGIVLDPFLGSGTTGVAAKRLGFQFIGIEREPEYFAIAQKRIEHAISDENDVPRDAQTSFDLEGA